MTEVPWGREGQRVSRRALLRSAVLGGSGLLAAYMVGCGDGGSGQRAPTPTASGPSPTPKPGVSWREITPAGLAPPARRDHSLVSDGQALYLFGGLGPEPLVDFWAYDTTNEEWTELAIAGPSARFGHGAVWDASNNRLLVFGGQSGTAPLNDLWAFDPAAGAWTELPSDGPRPAPRRGGGMAVDPTGRVMVLQGLGAGDRLADVWAYDPETAMWSEVLFDDGGPPARSATRALWDTVRVRLVMFGGQSTEVPYLDEVWTMDKDGWAQLARLPAPKGRHSFSMVYDAQAPQLIIFGGESEEGLVDEIWLFDAPDEFWSRPNLQNLGPSARSGHDAAWVEENGSMFVFGGNDGEADLGDLWELSGSAPAE